MWLAKNFIKIFENLPQHLSGKFIDDNLSITDIALKNWDLSVIDIAQSFFEVIDYRYRFNTERFIVASSDCKASTHSSQSKITLGASTATCEAEYWRRSGNQWLIKE